MNIHLTALVVIVSCLPLGFTALPTQAALPDNETYELVMNRYNILIDAYTECSYYLNPATLSVNGNERAVTVLFTRGELGGSECNGIFEFQVLTVRCNTQEVSFSDQIASPANWTEDWYREPQIAQQICTL
jgi:hypothetical protein